MALSTSEKVNGTLALVALTAGVVAVATRPKGLGGALGASHETSIARTQKRWQIRGVRADGGKLAFPVSAYDIFEASKIAEKKAKDGHVTDIVLVER